MNTRSRNPRKVKESLVVGESRKLQPRKVTEKRLKGVLNMTVTQMHIAWYILNHTQIVKLESNGFSAWIVQTGLNRRVQEFQRMRGISCATTACQIK